MCVCVCVWPKPAPPLPLRPVCDMQQQRQRLQQDTSWTSSKQQRGEGASGREGPGGTGGGEEVHATAGRCMSLCPPFAGVGSAILYVLVGVKRREAALSFCWVPMDLSLLQAACHTLPFSAPSR